MVYRDTCNNRATLVAIDDVSIFFLFSAGCIASSHAIDNCTFKQFLRNRSFESTATNVLHICVVSKSSSLSRYMLDTLKYQVLPESL